MATATSIKLDDDLKGRIQHLASVRRRTPHWIMREAISEYVAREENREAFRQETLNAWEEYKETGLHTSADEVDKWLESWGTDEELLPPVCHK